MSHSHGGGNPNPHVIKQGADFNEMLGLAYSPTNWPDTSGWTATYVVYPNGDASQPPALTLTSGSGITLGMQGEVIATTTLSGSAAEGATTVSLTSATGVVEGATIVIELDDGSLGVDTIADLAGTTVTLGGKLADPATSGNTVTVYDPDWAVTNVYIHMSKAATGLLSDWGVGLYQLDLLDAFGHVQARVEGTCCLERGYVHG